MNDARERLSEAICAAELVEDWPDNEFHDEWIEWIDTILGIALAHPDDLLAVMVDAGVVEVEGYWSPDMQTVYTQFHRAVPKDATPVHRPRRTEGES